MIIPYDLGMQNIVENMQKVKIDEFVRLANKELKFSLIQAQIDGLGVKVGLSTSRTRFNGRRIWFECPLCYKRKGILYFLGGNIGCRNCFGLKYKKQRFKGMIESQV